MLLESKRNAEEENEAHIFVLWQLWQHHCWGRSWGKSKGRWPGRIRKLRVPFHSAVQLHPVCPHQPSLLPFCLERFLWQFSSAQKSTTTVPRFSWGATAHASKSPLLKHDLHACTSCTICLLEDGLWNEWFHWQAKWKVHRLRTFTSWLLLMAYWKAVRGYFPMRQNHNVYTQKHNALHISQQSHWYGRVSLTVWKVTLRNNLLGKKKVLNKWTKNQYAWISFSKQKQYSRKKKGALRFSSNFPNEMECYGSLQMQGLKWKKISIFCEHLISSLS